LTANNLDKISEKPKKKKAAAASKPAWAMTEKMQEEAKEAEIDDLLEFAYELDYEKYMEDSEVRMALAVIKDRVGSLTQEDDWKQKEVDEYNNREAPRAARPVEADRQSNVSYSKFRSVFNIFCRIWSNKCF